MGLWFSKNGGQGASKDIEIALNYQVADSAKNEKGAESDKIYDLPAVPMGNPLYRAARAIQSLLSLIF